MQTHFLKPFLVLSLIVCFTTSPYCQYKMNDSTRHPYRVNYWVSGGIAVVGGVTNYLGIPSIINKQEISTTELNSLDKAAVGGFDRWVLNQDLTKEKADRYDKDALIVLSASVTLPAILAFDKYIGKDWSKMLVMYLETISIVSNVYGYSPLGPRFNDRFRPVTYYSNFPTIDRADGNNRNSFYSGHVASAAAASFFMAKVYSDYHPELGGKKYFLYAAATIPPILLGYFRLKGLRHFPSDALVGLGVGACVGILVPEIHRIKLKNKNLTVGLSSIEGSTGLSLKWKPASAIN
ncbi:MAG: phosphatase PAP2 family protein [Bacteroidota bacterium]